jgi:hypothetical protein
VIRIAKDALGNKTKPFCISCKLLTKNFIYKKKLFCFQVQLFQEKSLKNKDKNQWLSLPGTFRISIRKFAYFIIIFYYKAIE